VIALLMLLVMIFRPQGLLGGRELSDLLRRREPLPAAETEGA